MKRSGMRGWLAAAMLTTPGLASLYPGYVLRAPKNVVPHTPFAISLNLNFCIFPVLVFGNSANTR